MKRRTKIVGVLLAAGLVVISVLAGCKAAPSKEVALPPEEKPEVITWNFHCGYAESYMLGAVNKVFADLVEEKTDGRLKINIFYSAGLGYKGTDVAGALKKGALDSGEIVGMMLATEIAPWWSYNDFISVIINWDQGIYVRDAERPLAMEECREYGFIPLAMHNCGTRASAQGLWTNRELKTFDDLKGLTVRVFYPLAIDYQFKPLGMEGVWIAGAEIYPALKSGLVDAVFHSIQAGVTGHYYEIAKYFYGFDPHVHGSWWGIGCSPIAFNALPADMQMAVLSSGKEAQDLVQNEVFKYEEKYVTGRQYAGALSNVEAVEFLKEQGCKLYRVDNLCEEFQRLGLEGLKEWTGKMGARARFGYETYLEAREKYPGIKNEVYLGLEPLVLE